MSERGLSILVHGAAGAGKSTYGVTGPTPRLMMDAENSSRFVMQRKVTWNPLEQAPPVNDGTWDLCVVKIKNIDVANKTIEWLRSGNHPFRSVSIDSISEIQVKAQEDINGRNQMQTQHWGRLLQNMGGILRDLRDLVGTEESTIEAMILISTSKDYDGTLKPYLQGQIATQVPYLFDITGYLYVDQVANQETGVIEEKRFLFTGMNPAFEAKSRVPNLPPTIQDPNISVMLDNIFGPNPEDATQVVEPPSN